MTSAEQNNYIAILISAGATALLTALASYYATYRLKQNEFSSDKKLKTEDLAANLILVFDRLHTLFEKLRDDFSYLGYFSFKNIQLIQEALQRVKELNTHVILFPSELRADITSQAEAMIAFTNEVDSLERNPVNNFIELKEKTELFEKEYRDYTVELLKLGIYVGKNPSGIYTSFFLDPAYSDTDVGKKTLEIVEMVRGDMISHNDERKNSLQKIREESAKKRELLIAEILMLQKSLKDLIKTLRNQYN